jgi:hypothetical protein
VEYVLSIHLLAKISIFVSALFMISCGSAGVSSSSGGALAGGSTVIGSIASQSRNQSEMEGWVLVLLDKKTEIARVSEIGAAGLFSFPHVDKSATYTLVLISPSYVVSAVLAPPGAIANTVQQYFKITDSTLPRLIQKGPIITLQSDEGISLTKDLAADVNGDMIPDGIANVIGIELTDDDPSFGLTQSISTADIDTDGIRNIDDPDIDGDGLANVFDSEDDGDQIYDVFDPDSDGDAILDVNQQTHDLYFPIGVEWVSVKYEMIPTTSGSFTSTLTFYTKLRKSETMPGSVSILGAPYLLSGATVDELSPVAEGEEGAGERISSAWNKLLADDGTSEDGGKNDLLFAKKVNLEGVKTPAFHQVVFIRLGYGSGSNQWFMDFPYTFAPITPKAITATYSKLSSVVQLSGNPFGDIQDFVWIVNIYHPEKGKIYTSESTSGSTRTIKIPDNILEESDTTYTYKVTAQVLDRVPGYVNYTIDSVEADLK